jgi:hypothetical protein
MSEKLKRRPVKAFLKNPKHLTQALFIKAFSDRIKDDKKYLSLLYAFTFWRKMHWTNPQTFNEKLTWIKIYGRKELYTNLADKYTVKAHVAKLIGQEYVVENYGVYDRWDEIDFNKLPEKFVIKCTHDSGGAFVCTKSSEAELDQVRKDIEYNLTVHNFKICREWPYKNIPHRIIIDRYLNDGTGEGLRDFKFWCFNGKPTFMYMTVKSNSVFENFYDMDFNPVMIDHGFPRHVPEFEKPASFEKMKELAAKLSAGIPFVRIDFFYVDGQIYFGEYTFFDWGGMRPFKGNWDKKLGQYLELPTK